MDLPSAAGLARACRRGTRSRDGHGSQELCKGWGGMWQAEVGVCEEVQVGSCGQVGMSGLYPEAEERGRWQGQAGPVNLLCRAHLEPRECWKWTRGPNSDEGPAVPVPGHIIM